MVSARSTARLVRRSSPRGVTLLELLVVLAILLLTFTMAGILIGPPLRKARLASAANDVAVLAKRVAVEARTQRAGQGAFVFLRATPTTGIPATVTFDLVADTAGNVAPLPPGPDGQFQDPAGAGTDILIPRIPPVQLPEGIVVYNLPAPYDNSWTNWSPNATGTSFVLGLDFQGRTVGVNGRQIAGLASLNLTHADMVSGAITPLVVHRLTFGSVWTVRHTRLVKDPAVASGWREY